MPSIRTLGRCPILRFFLAEGGRPRLKPSGHFRTSALGPDFRTRERYHEPLPENLPSTICKILYTSSVERPARPIEFRGSALEDLSRFPAPARRKAGFQLFQVQQSDDPDDWKPMTDIGPGVKEIRIREKDGAFRVFYVACFAKTVYVLHCFQKKTQKTSDGDKDLAKRRYKELVREIGS